MQNVRLDETQAEIKIAWRNINKLRCADDTTLTAEGEEELKSLLIKEKSEKAGVKLNIQKTKTMRWGDNGNSDRLYFFWVPKSPQMVTAVMKLKDACSLEEKL